MRRRSLLVVSSIFAVTCCAIVAACSFPDVEFAAPSGGETGPGVDGGTDSPLEVGSDGFVVDGSDPDADIVKDAGQKIDAAGCTDCDCDDDGFNDLTKAGCADAGGANDCDDTDTTTKPSQTYTYTPPYPPRNGDWNCKDGVEKYFKFNVNCGSVAGGTACDSLAGFEDAPACGAKGSYVVCKTVGALPPLLSSCVVGTKDLEHTQACR